MSRCQECGANEALPCCAEEHRILCRDHYDEAVRHAEGDPILCPFKKDEMRWCGHESLSGVDQTPLDDPAKKWRCDACGQIRVGP